MRPHAFAVASLLSTVLVGLTGTPSSADELTELARTVRWRHLELHPVPPDDLVVDVPHAISDLQFTDFVYGTPKSPRVAVAVTQSGDDFSLYVDTDRDRGISERNRVDGSGSLRLLPLMAQHVVDNVVQEYPRKLLVRWQPGDSMISVATVTTIDHRDTDDFTTRQIDGNANGLFADTKDLLQVDANADGRFDPFLETFPFRPVVRIRGERYFVNADSFGERLQLSAAAATGLVKVTVAGRSENDQITDLIVTLAGEDGSVYSLTGQNAETELPTGRYAASVLFVALKPDGTDLPWEFTFSRNDAIRATDWLTVAEGKTLEFDPIGELTMDATVERNSRGGGANLTIQPRLFTESGLLINLCRIEGSAAYSGAQCSVTVVDGDGRTFGQSSSGFA